MRVFEELKQYLSRPPFLSRSEKEEALYAYLVVTNYAFNLVLVRNESGVQRPVYYVSKSLQETETHYLPLGKAVLAIVHATRKLPHYFSGIYCGGAHLASLVSPLTKIRLHRKNC